MDVTSAAVSDRLEITSLHAQHGAQPGFAQDVRTGLTGSPRTIPAKYHYDELGSVLFDAITVLPEYYLTRAETEILREWGWEIVRALGNPIDFVELGSGSAIKTRLLIEEALRVQRQLRYSPIEISPEALRASANALVAAYPELTIHGYAGDYFTLLASRALKRENRILAMFMGSNVGNYEPHEARHLLTQLAGALQSGDGLLLGADLKKDPDMLELAYDDPAGVTAAFNLNLLGRINRELQGTFDVRGFKHVALYDDRRGSVDSYLIAKRPQRVRIGALEMVLDFEEGERIKTESSYKFTIDDLAKLGTATGFELTRTWTDRNRRFAVALLVRK